MQARKDKSTILFWLCKDKCSLPRDAFNKVIGFNKMILQFTEIKYV